jgi:hypothetical protein
MGANPRLPGRTTPLVLPPKIETPEKIKIMSTSYDTENKTETKNKASNPDPITGAPGSHPIGTGLGAAAGGAAAGAAVGTVAGPAGTIAGAAVGAIIGGLAGKGVAEKINPTVEDAYWSENHDEQDYADGRSYDEFGHAYRVGYEGYAEYGIAGESFDAREAELRERYESAKPTLSWEEARPASRAAWEKLNKKRSDDPTQSSVRYP